jgi:hypothetical protein
MDDGFLAFFVLPVQSRWTADCHLLLLSSSVYLALAPSSTAPELSVQLLWERDVGPVTIKGDVRARNSRWKEKINPSFVVRVRSLISL